MMYFNKASFSLKGHLMRLWIVIALFIGALIVALFVTPLPSLIVINMAEYHLKKLGLHDVQITDAQITPTRLTFKNLAFSLAVPTTQKSSPTTTHPQEDRFHIDSILLTFEDWDILRGKISTILIEKPHIQLVKNPDLPDVNFIYQFIGESFEQIRSFKSMELTNGTLTFGDFSPLNFTGRLINAHEFKINILGAGQTTVAMTLKKENGLLNLTCISPHFMLQNTYLKLTLQDIALQTANNPTAHDFPLDMDLKGKLTALDIFGIGKLKKPLSFQAILSHYHGKMDYIFQMDPMVSAPSPNRNILHLMDLKGQYAINNAHFFTTFSSAKINILDWVDLTEMFMRHAPELILRSVQLQVTGNSEIPLAQLLMTGATTDQKKKQWFNNLTVKLDNLSFDYKQLKVNNARTQLVLHSLNPLSTKGDAILTFQSLLMPTMNFQQGRLVYTLPPALPSSPFSLILKRLDVDALGGKIAMTDFQNIDKNNILKGLSFTTEFNQIDLMSLVTLSNINDLTIEGKTSGSGHFVISDHGFDIHQLHLNSMNGVIRYILPKSFEHKQAKMALKALKNFHYDDLDLIVQPDFSNGYQQGAEKAKEHNIQAAIKISGFNPKILNGYPFEFNIKTSGQLGSLVRNLLNSLSGPQDIGDIHEMVNRHKKDDR